MNIRIGQMRKMCGQNAVILRRKSRDEVVIGFVDDAAGSVSERETWACATVRTWPVVGRVKVVADPRSPTRYYID